MKIIPVIDIQNGQLAHVVSNDGRENPFSGIVEPQGLISLLAEEYKFEEFYIDDLNARKDTGDNYGLIANLIRSRTDLSWIVDFHSLSPSLLNQTLSSTNSRFIVTSQQLGSLEEELLYKENLHERAVFYENIKSIEISDDCLEEVVSLLADRIDSAREFGSENVVIHNNFGGVKNSNDARTTLLRELTNQSDSIRIIAAGGIGTQKDVQALERSGIATILMGRGLFVGNILL